MARGDDGVTNTISKEARPVSAFGAGQLLQIFLDVGSMEFVAGLGAKVGVGVGTGAMFNPTYTGDSVSDDPRLETPYDRDQPGGPGSGYHLLTDQRATSGFHLVDPKTFEYRNSFGEGASPIRAAEPSNDTSSSSDSEDDDD
jgi:hypothetical protein